MPKGIIQPYSGIFRTLCTACICRNLLEILEYSEPFHNCIPTHIQNPGIFTKFTNIQNSDIFNMCHIYRTLSKIEDGVFAKIVKNYNNLTKALHLRSLTEF